VRSARSPGRIEENKLQKMKISSDEKRKRQRGIARTLKKHGKERWILGPGPREGPTQRVVN